MLLLLRLLLFSSSFSSFVFFVTNICDKQLLCVIAPPSESEGEKKPSLFVQRLNQKDVSTGRRWKQQENQEQVDRLEKTTSLEMLISTRAACRIFGFEVDTNVA